jgi:hypothetical protein
VALKENPFAPTLADKQGGVPHVSGVMRRIAQLSNAGEHLSDSLLKIS